MSYFFIKNWQTENLQAYMAWMIDLFQLPSYYLCAKLKMFMDMPERKFKIGDIVKVTIIDSDVEYEVIGFLPDTVGLFAQAMKGITELNVSELVQCKPNIPNGLTVELKDYELELVRRKNQ